MTCPICNADSIVTRTRGGERTRRCLDCGHEFATVEIYAHQYPRWQLKQHIAAILSRDNGGQK